ncbi:MFS transporter [Brevibacterium sp. BRM-1]|uniref:MFS transporter n=1 Tax=Brevibacterium sp. BRM-1 TaxID=2999062 RepID=UPI00227F5378|nr:MFS transporter [Brevibacterium sp. BRM-1]WAL39293.1 MFS transporter [Brevibacterium sp. BRM-1]
MALRDLFADTRPLRVPAYRRLFIANIVTVIGAQLTIVAVPAQIYSITGSSAYVGLTGIFGLVPLVVFGLYGGSLSDAMDRRRLLMVTGLGLAAASGLLWLLAFIRTDSVWLVLVALALQQAFFAVNQPARSAILPSLVHSSQLAAANTLNMTLMTFGAIVGPLVGGMLIPVLGYPLLYAFDAVALGVALWAIARLPALPPRTDAGGQVRRAGFASVMEGFAYLRTSPVLLMSFVVDIIAMVFGMPRAMFPQIAHESFGGPPSGGAVFALLSAGLSIGATAAGVFSGWVSRVSRQGRAVVICIVVWGAAMALFGAFLPLAHSLWWAALVGALACLMVGGGADTISAAFRTTMLQQAADDDKRGRLQGVFTVVVAGGPRIADVVHGYATSLVGTAWTSIGGGVLCIVGVLAAAALAPSFMRYRAPRDTVDG